MTIDTNAYATFLEKVAEDSTYRPASGNVPTDVETGKVCRVFIHHPLHGIDAGHDAQAVEAGGDIPPGIGDGPAGRWCRNAWCRMVQSFSWCCFPSGSNTPGLALEGRGADLCPGFDIGRDILSFAGIGCRVGVGGMAYVVRAPPEESARCHS